MEAIQVAFKRPSDEAPAAVTADLPLEESWGWINAHSEHRFTLCLIPPKGQEESGTKHITLDRENLENLRKAVNYFLDSPEITVQGIQRVLGEDPWDPALGVEKPSAG
jgi:hypothetical protein